MPDSVHQPWTGPHHVIHHFSSTHLILTVPSRGTLSRINAMPLPPSLPPIFNAALGFYQLIKKSNQSNTCIFNLNKSSTISYIERRLLNKEMKNN